MTRSRCPAHPQTTRRRRTLGALVAVAAAVVSVVTISPVATHAARRGGADGGGSAIGSHRPRDARHTDGLAASTSIVRFASGIDAAAGALALRAAGVTVYDTVGSVFQGAIVGTDPAQFAALQQDPGIAGIERDRVVTLDDVPAGTRQVAATQTGATWGLDRVDQRSLPLSGTYDSTGTGAGVTAYVLDSGVADQPDFGGRVAPGYWLSTLTPATAAYDCNGHGTHVAGILGSSTYGVAKGVTIVPVRVFACDGTASDADVIQGLDYILQSHQPGQPAVLNLSIGGEPSGAEDAAVQAMIDDGITVVVAAGNDGRSACTHTPARVADAITVAATDSADRSPDWSSWGSCVDVFAPGDTITSLSNTGAGAAVKSGTSMAAPFAGGVAALLLQQNPSWSPARVAAQLTANATPGMVSNAGDGSPNRLLYSLPVAAASLTSMTPARLLDTRPGSPTIDGEDTGRGPLAAFHHLELQVTGRAGIPATATTASLNVTVTEAQAPGFITVYPCGQSNPTASNVNFGTGDTVANAVIAPIGLGGRVCLYTYATTQLVVDVNGYSPVGALYDAVSPARLLDTRPGYATSDGQAAGIGIRGSGSVTEVQVTGRAGIPTSATTASINVTVTQAEAPGFVTVYPCGQPMPTASSVNFGRGETVANAVVSQIGAGGTVCLYTYAPTQLIADVNGFFPTGALYQAMNPARLLDSRAGYPTVDGQGAGIGLRDAGWVTELQIAGRAGIAANASTVSLNVTVAETQAPGFVTVYPCGQAVPTASNVNFGPGDTIPNAVITQIGAGGTVCVFTYAPTQLIVDVNGWWPAT